jgi:Rad3-related DNA helicase
MVPTDPIFKARSILFNDSFKEYSIPKSIIKLKQGF